MIWGYPYFWKHPCFHVLTFTAIPRGVVCELLEVSLAPSAQEPWLGLQRRPFLLRSSAKQKKSDVALIREIHSFFLCSKWGSTQQAICAVTSSHFSRTLAVKCCTLRCRQLTQIRQNLGWIPLLYAQIRQASLVNCSNWALQSAALLASVPDQQAFLPRHKIRKKRWSFGLLNLWNLHITHIDFTL